MVSLENKFVHLCAYLWQCMFVFELYLSRYCVFSLSKRLIYQIEYLAGFCESFIYIMCFFDIFTLLSFCKFTFASCHFCYPHSFNHYVFWYNLNIVLVKIPMELMKLLVFLYQTYCFEVLLNSQFFVEKNDRKPPAYVEKELTPEGWVTAIPISPN